MINAEAGNFIRAQQVEQKIVSGFENLFVLDTDGNQFGDGEESAVIDFVRADAPEGETVMLEFDELVEVVEGTRLTRFAVQLGEKFSALRFRDIIELKRVFRFR